MNETNKENKMKLGVLLHGNFTVTVHKENCRDLNNPLKSRSGGLESGYIFGNYVEFLNPKLDNNLKVTEKKELHDMLYDYHPMSYENIKIEFMGCCK
jgi:hypothetical protein